MLTTLYFYPFLQFLQPVSHILLLCFASRCILLRWQFSLALATAKSGRVYENVVLGRQDVLARWVG